MKESTVGKFSGALDKWCDVGLLTKSAPVGGKCPSCGREVRALKSGLIGKHVYELARLDAKAKPWHNSAANRGMRAWLERGEKR